MADQEHMEEPLMKVPDEVLLRFAKRDLGKANAYIAELEDKIRTIESDNKALIKSSELYKNALKQLNVVNKELHQCRVDKEKLITELVQLKLKE